MMVRLMRTLLCSITLLLGAALAAAMTPPPASSTPASEAAAPGVNPVTLDDLTALAASLTARLDALPSSPTDGRLLELRAAVAEAGPSTDRASQLYDEIVAELGTARARLRSALEELRSPSEVPAADAMPASVGDPARWRAARDHCLQLEAEARWHETDRLGHLVRALDQLRQRCLDKLSTERRTRVLGLTRDGVAQLVGEVDQLAVSLDLYRETRRRQAAESARLVRDLPTVVAVLVAAFKTAFILVPLLLIRLRWRPAIARLRDAANRTVRSPRWLARIETALSLAESLMPWLLFLLAVAGVRWAIGSAADQPEVAVVLAVAALYGVYRIAVEVLQLLVIGLAGGLGARLETAHCDAVGRNIRWVLRVVLLVVVVRMVVDRTSGRGYLFATVSELSWLLVIATLLAVVVSWRQVMADAYLSHQPRGRLAALVRRSRNRVAGILVAPVSFLWLIGRAVALFLRRFTLGFDESRKAMAFVLRHRIEKRAEQTGFASGDLEGVPALLIEALTEEPVSAGELVVDHFPGLDRLHSALDDWRHERCAGAFLLTGDAGMGTSSWLCRARETITELVHIRLDRRMLDEASLAEALRSALGPETETPASLAELAATLHSGPPRVLVVQGLERTFLSSVGGYQALTAFASLVADTAQQVFWLCTMAGPAWRRAHTVRPELAVFRHHQHLEPWDEGRIHELISVRARASGVELDYSDLVIEPLEGLSDERQLHQSAEGYARLLWDYCDGNPEATVHFFKRSLVAAEDGGEVKVRLFRAPPVERLAEMEEEALFVLAAIVAHSGLTAEQCGLVNRLPDSVTGIHVERLLELGAVECANGAFQITTAWHRPAVRLLRRRNLMGW
jgi:hypothetical protein